MRGGSDDVRTAAWNDQIVPYIYDKNTYGNMAEILKALGIKTTNQKDYNTQFGIVLNKLAPKIIEGNNAQKLLSESSAETVASSKSKALNELNDIFDISTGETDMLVLANLDLPPQAAYVVTAAQPNTRGTEKIYGSIGVCHAALNPGKIDAARDERGSYGLDIRGYAESYFSQGPGMGPSVELDFDSAKVTLIQAPKHGVLGKGRAPGNDTSYYPTPGYFGNDKAIFLVDIQGYKIKVVYNIKLVRGNDYSKFADDYKKYCESPGWWWMGSAPNVDKLLSSFLQNSNQINLTLARLPGTAVGQTTGTGNTASITLDTNAADHGWFIDSTPAVNSD